MLETIDDIVQRLVERYEPDRVILYGSRAQGRARPGSDIDLLIVKDTSRRPVDRRVAVESLLLDRRPGLDVDVAVYTPQELRALYLAGSPFIEEVMETGQVLFMRKATAVWLREADDDYHAAEVLLASGHARAACLHGQQAVEKALKAALIERGQRPPRTHGLITLRDLVQQAGVRIGEATDELVFLNNVYRSRSPSEDGLIPHGEPAEGRARRAVQAAGVWVADVRRALERAEDAGVKGETEGTPGTRTDGQSSPER